MAAKDPSVFDKIEIISADGSKSADIRGGTVTVQYFEDVFSPTISAKLLISNTGNTITGKDGKKQSLYNGLPLRGGEVVKLKIGSNSKDNPGLDFDSDTKKHFRVASIDNVIKTTESETFVLNLFSREALSNETSRVGCKYPSSSPISETVKDIIKKYLKSDKIKDKDVEATENPYGFIGNMRKPFTVITWLASKSVPGTAKGKDATAGYLFFQTKDGYVFKSVDALISSKKFENAYTYQEVIQGGKVNNDYNIIKYATKRNQDLIKKLKRGSFCSHRMFLNPLTFEYTPYQEGLFKSSDYIGKAATLGEQVKLPKVDAEGSETLGDIPSRNITAILDVGTIEVGVSTAKNADPSKTQSQAMMRYGLITTQTLSMTIPSNTNLKAGNVIECKFPRVDTNKESKEIDQEQSGLYMIKALCHHFDSAGSFTSLELIKDTFGHQDK